MDHDDGTTPQLDTLADICLSARRYVGFRPMVPVDQGFFDYLYLRQTTAPPPPVGGGGTGTEPAGVAVSGGATSAEDVSTLDFTELPSHWARIISSGFQPPPKYRCTFPIELARQVVIGGHEGTFMGPLCCPLTKSNAGMVALAKDEYWVTEKSDGVRVIFTSLLCPQFPRWRIVLQHNNGCDVNLYDAVSLESGFSELLRNASLSESSQIRLSFGSHVLRRTAAPDVFHLVLRTSDLDAPERAVVVVRQLTPRHFAFVFDRSVSQVYLLLDEYPFMNLSCVVLDAEMLFGWKAFPSTEQSSSSQLSQQEPATPAPKGQHTLGIAVFDCFACKDVQPCDLSTSMVPFVKRFSPQELDVLQRRLVSERIEVMRERAFVPMYRVLPQDSAGQLLPQCSSFLPPQVPIVLKDLVLVDEMPQKIISKLRRVFFHRPAKAGAVVSADRKGDEGSENRQQYRAAQTSSHVVFEGYLGTLGVTKSDGFIFTPNVFDIISGSRPTQLKWKWPEMLTVDWLVRPAHSHKPGGMRRGNYFDVSLFFKKKRKDGRADEAGHPQYSRFLRMLNPNHLTISGDECIVECSFNANQRLWVMHKLRKEKKEANSVTTVISVLESIAENIDVRCLCDLLELSSPLSDAELQHLSNTAIETHHQPEGKAAAERTTEAKSFSVGTTTTTVAEDDPKGGALDRVDGEGENPAADDSNAIPPPCRLVVRASALRFSSDVSLSLQWAVVLPKPDKRAERNNVMVCNHRSVDDCFGLGQGCPSLDPGSKLKELLMIELANSGGCFGWSNVTCDAFFDASTGRWGILTLHKQDTSNHAFFTQVMDHLTALAVYRAHHNGALPPPITPHHDGRAFVAARGAGDVSALTVPTVATTTVETNEHYASRTKELSHGYQSRSSLRRVNNFVKSMLIQSAMSMLNNTKNTFDWYNRRSALPNSELTAASATSNVVPPPLAGTADAASVPSTKNTTVASEQAPLRWNVMDICCGRGGDLHKWKAHPVGFLMMVDSCLEAVAEAAARYNVAAGLSTKITKATEGYPGIPAMFAVRDCFERPHFAEAVEEAKQILLSANRNSLFDLVSCQFSMHYGMETREKTCAFLENVASSLRTGGYFIGTTVDDKALLRRRNTKGPSFGNDLYSIRFLPRPSSSSDGVAATAAANQLDGNWFGEAYEVDVEQSVQGAVEYVVHWKPFVALAATYHLQLVESSNFQEAYDSFLDTDAGQRVLETIVKESGPNNNNMAKQGHHDQELDEHNTHVPVKRQPNGRMRVSLEPEEEEVFTLFRTFTFRKV